MKIKILMLLTGVLILTGCSNFRETSVSEDGEIRMLMTDNEGEVEIPANPERMVLMRPVDVLNAHLLGGDIAAVTETVRDNEFVNAHLDDVAFVGEEDFDAVHEADPDLVIISSQHMGRSEYQELAPTLSLNYSDEFFNSYGDRVYLMQLAKMGVILGAREEAEALTNDWMERMTEHRRALDFDPGQYEAAVLVEGAEGFFIYDEYSSYGTEIMYDLLNFDVAEDMRGLRHEEPFRQFRPAELEGLGTDYALVNKRPGTDGEALAAELSEVLGIPGAHVLVVESEDFITNDLISLEGQARIIIEKFE
ncbi:ABC transporter substrate-binding protein [Lacicoccus alkaliphilus]|uniref:Substrate-binding protein n=1 Tax=Lacicoccus alkaliphilus DSM 16010 TaxID=1123231 RepID=A0A1M7J5Y2_9BACL|nr:ABC transporter substrate-binding protein [Salinicoccus alkaliphilus]SHM48406.1 substrate-binding protein [Salinicoccus alkaliphilus DSM 16010]